MSEVEALSVSTRQPLIHTVDVASSERPGSHGRKRGMALPAVLVLLVLLAIMGASFLHTSRVDRGASAANQANTQVTMLIDGVWAMARSNLTYDVYDASQDPPRYRPAGDLKSPGNYRPADSYYDTFLADRVPATIEGKMTWANITGPLNGAGFQDPTKPLDSPKYGRVKAVPGSVTIDGKVYPAFDYAGLKYVAADTDGDGIADAGLWPLNVGQSNGVTWFAAARIVDHNSAVNASVAWAPNRDGKLPGQFFPTNVDLQSLLVGGAAEMDRLNRFRAGGRTIGTTPVGDDGSTLSQFTFLNGQDALWMQLGRRLNNPGYVERGVRFRALPASDSVALARPIRGDATATTLGGVLSDSLPAGRTRPFAADDIDNWAKQFDFGKPDFNRQALLTTSSPVANAAMDRAVPPQLERYFGKAPAVPSKTSINTAGFEDLFRSFWAVMCDEPLGTEFGDVRVQRNLYDKDGTVIRSIDDYNPFRVTHPQRMFRSPIRDVRFEYVENDSYDGGAGDQEKRTARLKPLDVMLLRSAIAAVNAMDLRDADRDVTVRTIPLKATIDNVEVEVKARVYGNEPQPFLTEFFAHTDTHTPGGEANRPNRSGYVAVELYNPHPFDIRMTNWRLQIVDRRRNPDGDGRRPTLTLANVDGVIPALGYILLENYDPEGESADAAAYRPRSTGLPEQGYVQGTRTLYVPELGKVIANGTTGGGELVIARPVNADGAASGDEDFVPVDQFDYTGLRFSPEPTKAAAGEEQLYPYTIWHYARATGASHGWKWVYPGRYDGTRADRRQDGTNVTEVLDRYNEPTRGITHLGKGGGSTYYNPFPGIQIAAVDTPGPFPLRGGGNRFPFGGFARLGDILHVPFVGAYRITDADDKLVELHSVSMDTAFGDDADPDDDSEEQIGRFNPILGTGNTSPLADLPDHPPIDWSAHSAAEHGVAKVYENLRIRPPVNTKGLRVGCVQDWGWVPRSVLIRNVDVGEVYRNSAGDRDGLHLDCIQVQLAGDAPTIKTDVTVENVYIHDSNVESLLIQDGSYGTVKIKNVRFKNCKSPKLVVQNSGSFDRIIIENCPNVKFSILGRMVEEIGPDGQVVLGADGKPKKVPLPGGNIGPITVINSPGCFPKDENGNGLNITVINNGGEIPQLSANDFGGNSAAWRYRWAMDLFDHFTTVANPNDDYFPNVDPKTATYAKPVRNGFAAGANDHREDDAAVEGLININTAPWPVLATLPMCDDPADNVALAKAIVAHRESTGRPFVSLFELNNVFDLDDTSKGFRNSWGKLDFGRDFKLADGDISPVDGSGDSAVNDYEQKNLMLTRISNLVTTRSDGFTVYLMVQGWRNAGTPRAELVGQRRAAYTVDRSALTGRSRTLKTMSVPMD